MYTSQLDTKARAWSVIRYQGGRWGAGDKQMCTTHTMSDTDDGARHLLPLHINKLEEITRMVKPTGCTCKRSISVRAV